MSSIEKDAKISEAYELIREYPGSKTAILDRLVNAKTLTISIDDYNNYEAKMISYNITEPDTIVDKYPDIPEFTQTDKMSDAKILQAFEAKDELEAKKEEIGKVPTDAEWAMAGEAAELRIAKLRPFYETKKAEEWEELDNFMAIPEDMSGDFPFGALSNLAGEAITGVAGLTQEMFFGWMDWMNDFKEVTGHEKGLGTSFNPFTGFGAWDLAELRTNTKTGQQGFSPELLAMEEELERLYGHTREYREQYIEGGYGEVGNIDREINAINQIIDENKLLDPRLTGER